MPNLIKLLEHLSFRNPAPRQVAAMSMDWISLCKED